jgi:tetratricopeptide (TPR) repeat protein
MGRLLADPALQALATHELARLAQTRGDFAAMRLLAEQTCTQARQANLPDLAAESLNDLGIAVSLDTHPLAGIPYFQEALDCLRQRPNHALEARIVGNLGYFHLAGHNYQSAYRYLQQSRTLRSLLQGRENNLIMLIHFGDLWVALGAYSQAQQAYAQGLALVQTKRAPYWESWLHASYGRLQHLHGDPAAAQTTCRLARQIAQKDGSPSMEQWALINLGHALADLGDPVAAGSCYQQAIAAPKGRNWLFYLPDAHAGLAALCLAQNEGAIAVTHTEAALALLAQQGLSAAGDPFAVYWTCIRVLEVADDPRARTVLATAYQLLMEIAHQLEDEWLRRSFLENVVANRNLVAAAQAAGLG